MSVLRDFCFFFLFLITSACTSRSTPVDQTEQKGLLGWLRGDEQSFGDSESLRPGRVVRGEFLSRVEARPEVAHFLENVEVVLADPEAFARDFGLNPNDQEGLLGALIDCCSYMVESQLNRDLIGVTNTEIRTTGRTTEVLRPIGYGRASVATVSFDDERTLQKRRLLDVKGTGWLNPSRASHRTGLLTLQEGLKDFYFSKLLQIVLAKEKRDIKVLPTYAVIAIDVKTTTNDDRDPAEPAALLVRAAHYRGGKNVNLSGIPYMREPSQVQALLELELALRKYGITSSAREGPHDQIVNFQFSRDDRLLDFGSYHLRPQFASGLVLLRSRQNSATWKEFVKNPEVLGSVSWFSPARLVTSREEGFVSKPNPELFLAHFMGENALIPPSGSTHQEHFCSLMLKTVRQLELQKQSFDFLDACD